MTPAERAHLEAVSLHAANCEAFILEERAIRRPALAALWIFAAITLILGTLATLRTAGHWGDDWRPAQLR